MKKLLFALLALLLVLTASALADKETLPDEIADLFDVPAWEDYEVPYTTKNPDMLAYLWLEHSDCGLVLQKKGDKNVLCLIERNKDGEMRIVGRNYQAVRGNDVPIFDSTPYEGNELGVTMEVHGGDYELCLLKISGQWRVTTVYDYQSETMVSVSQNKLGYCPGWEDDGFNGYYFDTDAMVYAYGVFDNRFVSFNWNTFPKTLAEAREKLTNPPVTPMDFYAPQTVTLRTNEKYDVFAAPGRDSYRAANGKAVMSTNDWVQIFGEEDGWLLVQYDISSDRMRFGYIDASALPENAEVPELIWFTLPEQTVNTNTFVTDDPLNSCVAICQLSAGDKVRVLASFDNWYYIEITNEYGQLLRGFVPMSCIDIADAEDMVG